MVQFPGSFKPTKISSLTSQHIRNKMSTHRCQRIPSFFLLLVLSATFLVVNGQQRSTFLRSMSQVRSAPLTATTTKAPTIKLEEVDRTSDLESRPSLNIQPEDRIKLRQSVMDLTKRRRVTAIKPTMSPDVISTPNVYHFFSKKRFDRVRNSTKTTTESPTTTEVSSPTAVTLAA